MVANLVTGALLGGGLFSILGLLRGEIALYAMAGVVLGLLLGVQWWWRDKRTDRYRSKHDPPGPTLTLESLPRSGPPPAMDRYGAPARSTIGLLLLLAVTIPLVVIGSLTEKPAWMWLVVWGVVTVPLGWLLWTLLYTYTEVTPDGILLRKPFKSQLVMWSELAEVGWLRNPYADVVTLSTLDGRQVKTVGISVSPTGDGRHRVLRMLADIERAWAAPHN